MRSNPLSDSELRIIKEEMTDLVILDLEGKTREDALLNIAEFAKEKGLIKDAQLVYQKFIDREAAGTTAIGQGVALPEACWIEMTRPYAFILCRTMDEIDFNSLDGEPVRIVLAALGGNKEDLTRLKHIAYLTKALKSKIFRTQFLTVKTEMDAYSVLCAEGMGFDKLRQIVASRQTA